MTAFYETTGVALYLGDCIEVMRTMPDECVDAVVTDPPYGLEFMGKAWDRPANMLGQMAVGDEQRGAFAYGGTHSRGYADHDGLAFQRWTTEWASECMRLLKPGGHLLAFGGTRTWHRLGAGIEDAGFEIRDSIAWLYGSGFPKSLDVSKAIDKAAGVERQVVGVDESKLRPNKVAYAKVPGQAIISEGGLAGYKDNGATITAPATDEARAWNGWGTALKPAFEPIVVARKPFKGTVVQNVLEHGTGALNIDANRTEFESEEDREESVTKNQHADFGTEAGGNKVYGDFSMVEVKNYDGSKGRWPTNVLLEESQAAELNRQSGILAPGHDPKARAAATGDAVYALGHAGQPELVERHAVAGGASRFFPTFRYEAKASTAERPEADGVQHPTVKPLDLMQWLVRLVTPPGGVVLEPFAGSGTTVEACIREGFSVVAIEREETYIPLILKRIEKDHQQSLFGDWDEAAS